MTAREAMLARLRARTVDVLVIGGGIVGAGIARDAAMRGLSVALIERGDFASGTSSKTSKLIHGGLRYLEHGRVRLVFESLRERHILRTVAPSMVTPLSLLLPVYRGDRRAPWMIHLGLWLYDLLATGRRIQPHRMLAARRALAAEPALRADGLRAAGLYADCQMDDARLCLANILQAASLGAVCANYVRLRALLKARQVICGALAENVLTGQAFEMHARCVVNATGPWADGLRRLSQADAPVRLAPSKGIHLVVPRLAQEALFVQRPADGRLLFILPWGERTVVGTTETAVHPQSLDTLAATADEVGYLVEAVNHVLPGAHLSPSDVIGTFAGARPLLAHAGQARTASREHQIEVDDAGLLSVLGGKYTTYRLMAKQVVDLIVSRGRFRADRCLTDQISLLETPQVGTGDYWHELARRVDPDLLARWLGTYGSGTIHLLQLADHEPALAQPLCPHHDVTCAELVHAMQREMSCTITDVLARRTRVAWSPCQGLDALSTVLALMARYGSATSAELAAQVKSYRAFCAQAVACRAPSEPTTMPMHATTPR